jgi:PPK2 family polyphosphate:nucleotide phosphotransferase
LKPTPSPYLVPTDGTFDLSRASTKPLKPLDERAAEKKLKKRVKQLAELQGALYADDRHSVLLVFQAMDAAGKDSTIRAVLSGINPAGFQVHAFKQPSKEELDHDFLWRTQRALPERGRIGVFNRSYYEEVLVVRVHPEYLGGQRLPRKPELEALWQERFESICDHEKHLARNGYAVLKFFLNVSREEQHRRFVARIDDPEKNWKFAAGDVVESRLWDKYMEAYQVMLAATSTKYAPWYCVPADDKPYMRMTVANILRDTIKALPLTYPKPSESDRARMLELKKELVPSG